MRATGIVMFLVAFINLPAQAQEEPLFAGVLNSWGIAIPELIYEDGTWRRLSGPEAFREGYGAIRGENRYRWRLYVRRSRNRILEGGPLVRFQDPYFVEWGLLTDFPTIGVDPRYAPSTVGPIVSHPHEFVGITEGTMASLQRGPPVEVLTELMEDWEGPPEFSLTNLYWISGSNLAELWVYLRAERWMDDDRSCPSVEVLDGWMRAPGGATRIELSSRKVTDCEYKTVETLRPLGLLELGERSFVVVEVAGWESSWVDIVELGSDGAARLGRN